MKIEILEAGYCMHPEFIVQKGKSFRSSQFLATVLLITHPTQGLILFDTGYSQHFFSATRHWPEKAYALTTPVHLQPGRTALEQLQKKGIHARDIRTVILSHFHADHVSGVRDFPRARYVCRGDAYTSLIDRSRLARLKAGFLKDLLPDDFVERGQFVSEEAFAAKASILNGEFLVHDLFKDESLFLVSLPGHAAGHIGLYVNHGAQSTFFVADAAWRHSAIVNNIGPSLVTRFVIEDWKKYSQTLQLLHEFQNKGLRIIPCHCEKHQLDLMASHLKGLNES